MKDALVGYTGFVGSNIAACHQFNGLYNSKNIEEAYETEPELLVYAGVPAEMFLANHYPDKDLAQINNAIENIRRINPKKIILISTIAVYDDPIGVDEDAHIDIDKLSTYGRNRRLLEQYVEENYPEHLIVRLPALFGNGLKKNFIYDYIHFIPPMLAEKKFNEIKDKNAYIDAFYTWQENGFYKVNSNLSKESLKNLKQFFENIGFSALNFTDSRSIYQFYNLAHLWEHIEIAEKNHVHILNTAVEPIKISDLYSELTGREFKNEFADTFYNYDYRTKYASLYNENGQYIFKRQVVVEELKRFIECSNV